MATASAPPGPVIAFGFATQYLGFVIAAVLVTVFGSFASPEMRLGETLIASLVLTDSEQRLRHTEGIYMPKGTTEHLGFLEETFRVIKRAEVVDRKVRAAVKAKTLAKAKGRALYDAALAASVITAEEHALLLRSEEMRNEAIQVDDFSQEEYLNHSSHRGPKAVEEHVA